MPFEFLTDDHLNRYAHYNDDPVPDALGKHFYLEPNDLKLINKTREPHNRLGLAVQLCTLRYLGTFLTDPTDVPRVVVQTVAHQLGMTDTRTFRRYLERRSTRFEHAKLVRDHLGYTEFSGAEALRLMRWLYAKLLIGDERPIVLFDLCTRQLEQRKVVLPGATTLARVIVRVRERVSQRLYRDLAGKISPEPIDKLETLLLVPEGERFTRLERLRVPPTRVSSPSLVAALERIEAIRSLGVGDIDLSDVPESRLWALARFAMLAWGQTISKLAVERRRATLLAFAQHLERSATDDALDVFDALMGSLGLKGERQRRRERLRTLRDLDASALVLRDVGRLVLDSGIEAEKLRATVLARIGEGRLLEAIGKVSELASNADDEEVEVWLNASAVVGRFILKLLTTIQFEGTPTAKPLLDAMIFIARTSGKPKASWGKAPRDFVPKRWTSIVFLHGEIDRSAFLVCVAHQLRQALKQREVFVARSQRYGDPRAQLLQGDVWAAKRAEVCRSLGFSTDAQTEIDHLAEHLDRAYRRVSDGIEDHPGLRLEVVDGVLTPKVAPLEAMPEPGSLKLLTRQAESRLPDIDFSELLLEVNACTSFVDEIARSGENQPRAADIEVSICAVLVAQACNIGLKAVAQANHPALSLSRLAWVQQTYVRSDTILRANARLVDHHAALPLTQRWGGGEVASADGLRFVVPVRSIYTGSNSRYFGAQRGITYYTLTSDQFTMLHGIVIPGTLRDSLFILSTLLDQQTSLNPREVMSDTAGYSDVVFGLFLLLGYQFSPRLADLESTRYWRVDRHADYGKLNDISKNRVNTALIAQHWDDILRVAGSLKLGAVKAPDVMRVLARDGSLSGLGKAIAEVGRIAKTMYLLEYVSDETYRRRIHTQLNRGESRGQLARAVMHGRKGEIREKYRAGMEDQLGALGLVVNAIALWNTRYLQAALDAIRAMGDDVFEADVSRLSPLKFAHINMLGRYHFEMSPDVAGGDLRPLRDPNAVDPLENFWVD